MEENWKFVGTKYFSLFSVINHHPMANYIVVQQTVADVMCLSVEYVHFNPQGPYKQLPASTSTDCDQSVSYCRLFPYKQVKHKKLYNFLFRDIGDEVNQCIWVNIIYDNWLNISVCSELFIDNVSFPSLKIFNKSKQNNKRMTVLGIEAMHENLCFHTSAFTWYLQFPAVCCCKIDLVML